MTRGTPLPSPPLPLPSLPSLPLVTQRIHSPFQPKQSPSLQLLHVPLLNVYPHVRRFRLDIAGTSHAIDWLVQ